jgi:hypothetical protein
MHAKVQNILGGAIARNPEFLCECCGFAADM